MKLVKFQIKRVLKSYNANMGNVLQQPNQLGVDVFIAFQMQGTLPAGSIKQSRYILLILNPYSGFY